MPKTRTIINKPRGKMTPYAFFVQTCREERKKEHPEENFVYSAFSKKCSERWKTVSKKEKQRFIDMSELDKQRYDFEMQNYRPIYKKEKRRRQQVKDPNAPKRTINAERANIKATNPEYKPVEIAKELGRRWSVADLQTRSKYELLFERDKKRYEMEMLEYRQSLKQQQLEFEPYEVKVEFDYEGE